MCTATFLPYKNGFLLTHNRDEFVERSLALPPQTYIHTNELGEKLPLTYPKDPKGGVIATINIPKNFELEFNNLLKDFAINLREIIE